MSDEVLFECAMCGRCCSQRLILLNTDDVFRIAAHFGLHVPEFMQRYNVVFATTEASKTPRLYLKVAGEKCQFFTDRCSIHPIKPLICRLFPGISPTQTAGQLKAFVNRHALSEGIKACRIFGLPDGQRVAADREAMVTTAIYDSVETIYYSNLQRQDMRLALSLLRSANNEQLRAIVSDYLFNGSRESGLVFEQAMFEVQAMCQLLDWKRTPHVVVHEGALFEPGQILVSVSPQDAKDIYEASDRGEIEAAFSQANPSIADPECAFVSVAVKLRGDRGLMMAFLGRKSELRHAAPDGRASLGFCPSDSSMDAVGAVSIFIDPGITKATEATKDTEGR